MAGFWHRAVRNPGSASNGMLSLAWKVTQTQSPKEQRHDPLLNWAFLRKSLSVRGVRQMGQSSTQLQLHW